MALKLWQIWLAAGLITPAPACVLESSGEADGETASPVVLGDAGLTAVGRQTSRPAPASIRGRR